MRIDFTRKIALAAVGVLVFSALGALPLQETRRVSVEALIYDLKHPDSSRRKEAASLLGQNRIQQAVPALIETAGDSEPEVRLEVGRALVRINDPQAIPAYVRLSHDTNQDVQQMAVEGIVEAYAVQGDPGFVEGVRKVVDFFNPFSDDFNPLMVEPYVSVDPEAVQAVSGLLTSDSVGIRKNSATALGILRARAVLPKIQTRLQEETNSAVKIELIRAIYKIGDPEAAEVLIPLTRAPDKKVHDEAIFVLGRLRVKEAAPVLRDLYSSGVEERRKILGVLPVTGSDDLQKNLFQALSYIGDSADLDLFLSALSHETEFYRRYGAEGLARIADADLVDVTDLARRRLEEKSDRVKLACAFALFRLGRKEHLVELVGDVRREQVYDYLMEFGVNEVAELYSYLSDDQPAVTARLLDVIGQRGDSSALVEVEKYTAGKSAEVASAANLAIRRLRARGTS